MKRDGLVAIALACVASVASSHARADELHGEEPHDEVVTIFHDGVKALGDGRPGDAIADFEALGDRGVLDADVSFDRGLAYAQRIRAGAAVPGDLGRAAHGFEEARSLAEGDAPLTRDATKALAIVRAEVARRRALAGEPVDVDPGLPLFRAIVELAPEDAWAVVALASSALLTAALFVRWLARAKRVALGAAIAIAIASPVLALTALLALAARDERLHLREGVVVAESARLADDRHIVIAGSAPLPEAARVTIDGAQAGWTRVRFAGARGWVPSSTIRPIARSE